MTLVHCIKRLILIRCWGYDCVRLDGKLHQHYFIRKDDFLSRINYEISQHSLQYREVQTVWPDWAIFEGLGDKFSCKSSPIICQLFVLFLTIVLQICPIALQICPILLQFNPILLQIYPTVLLICQIVLQIYPTVL